MAQIYQEKVTFDNRKTWYQLEWEDIDFRTFDNTEGLKDSQSIKELTEIIMKAYPDCKLKSTFIGKRK